MPVLLLARLLPSWRLLLRRGPVAWLVTLAGCTSSPLPKRYRIGFSQCTNDDAWRQAMLAGMKKEFALKSASG